MADDADRAQLEIESEVTRARLAAGAGVKLIPDGHCHNCDARLDGAGQLFCDRECSHDFERRQRAIALRKL
jgi:hypothetical protein